MRKFDDFLQEAVEKEKTHYVVHEDTGIRRGPYPEEEAVSRAVEWGDSWSIAPVRLTERERGYEIWGYGGKYSGQMSPSKRRKKK